MLSIYYVLGTIPDTGVRVLNKSRSLLSGGWYSSERKWNANMQIISSSNALCEANELRGRSSGFVREGTHSTYLHIRVGPGS